MLYQKMVNKIYEETLLCHSCTPSSPSYPEKFCKYFHQKGPNSVILFHSVKIKKKKKSKQIEIWVKFTTMLKSRFMLVKCLHKK